MFPRPLEIAGDQRPDLLGFEIIGIIIARRQHIGADQDALLDLRPKASGAGCGIHVVKIAALRQDARPVPHPVITGEIGGRLGWCDDIIGRQGIFGVR